MIYLIGLGVTAAVLGFISTLFTFFCYLAVTDENGHPVQYHCLQNYNSLRIKLKIFLYMFIAIMFGGVLAIFFYFRMYLIGAGVVAIVYGFIGVICNFINYYSEEKKKQLAWLIIFIVLVVLGIITIISHFQFGIN